MKDLVMRSFATKALGVAGKAQSINEAIALFEKEMTVYEALQEVKKMPNIQSATLVLQARVGGCNRFKNSGFTPEEGDIVRGAFQNFEDDYVSGFGKIDINNLAEALGRKETSVLAAMRWILGANQDRLIRKVPDSAATAQVLQAIAC